MMAAATTRARRPAGASGRLPCVRSITEGRRPTRYAGLEYRLGYEQGRRNEDSNCFYDAACALPSLWRQPLPGSHRLAHLSGYLNSRPVRVGNAAHTQLQLDVYGEVLRAAAIAYRRGAGLSGDERSFLRGLVNFVLENWRLPGSGIWETRGRPRQFVHSKVMCWVALDRALQLIKTGQLDLDAAPLRSAADEIRAVVEKRGFNRALDSYASAVDGSELDAAVLTLPLVGFEDPNSPRMTSTIRTIRRELARGDLVFRHQNEETGGEGAFLLCSFWLVQCLALQGNVEQASRLFDQLCSRANDVGLYPEEIDPESGRFLGNFPQAFTHIGLINAALSLERAKTEGTRKGGSHQRE